MNRLYRYTLILFFVFALILVRKFETILFYDPFLNYFHGKTGRDFYPHYDLWKVVVNIVFRYALNSVISLLLIELVFLNRRYVFFSVYIYLVFLTLLLPVYICLVENYFELGENIGFYIRRFLIQPLLLLILIPAFLYLKVNKQTE